MATGTQDRRDHVLDRAKLAPASGRRRRAEGKPQKNFPCQECPKAFNSLEKLKVHSYSHSGERPHRCAHLHCSKAFVSKYKLLRHTATHSPEKSHKCSYCEKTFHRKDHLKNHLHTHDPHKQAFACRECGKSYNTKLGFKRHLALHAANSGDLTCQVCLQPFPSTAVLLDHLKSHAGKPGGGAKEKKHRCEHCERRFYTRKDVRRHLVVHTGRKDFLCQYCAQRFGRKDHLTRHVKKSHARELLRVKTEPADPPEPPPVYDLPRGAIKGELSGTRQPNVYGGPPLDAEPFAPPPHPFPLKYPLGSAATSFPAVDQNLKGLETYLLELQSAGPSSSSTADPPLSSRLPLMPQGGVLEGGVMLEGGGAEGGLSRPASEGDSLTSSSLMDFSQLFNFLPLNGPPYNQVGGGGGPSVSFPLSEEPPHLVQLPPPPAAGAQAADSPLQGLPPPFMSSMSAPTTLPRFHQAFQ